MEFVTMATKASALLAQLREKNLALEKDLSAAMHLLEVGDIASMRP